MRRLYWHILFDALMGLHLRRVRTHTHREKQFPVVLRACAIYLKGCQRVLVVTDSDLAHSTVAVLSDVCLDSQLKLKDFAQRFYCGQKVKNTYNPAKLQPKMS